MQSLSESYSQAISSISSRLSPPVCLSALVGMYSLSALSKFISDEHKRLFPTLPSWFWSLAGGYELVMTALLLHGDLFLAVPMSYTYLGGAVSAGVLLSPGLRKLPLTVLPSVFIVITSSLGHHNRLDIFPLMPICCCSGFLMGVLLGYPGHKEHESS